MDQIDLMLDQNVIKKTILIIWLKRQIITHIKNYFLYWCPLTKYHRKLLPLHVWILGYLLANTRLKEHSTHIYLLSIYVTALIGNSSNTSHTLWYKSIYRCNDLLKIKAWRLEKFCFEFYSFSNPDFTEGSRFSSWRFL